MKKLLLFILLLFVYDELFSQWSSDPNVNTTLFASGAANPKSISDGVGGVLTIYDVETYDGVTTKKSLFAQRLATDGIVQWGQTGIAVTASTTNVLDKIITTDGNGGIIVIWIEEQVAGSYTSKVYAQRIDNTGNKIWGANGIEINSVVADYELADLIKDSNGNYIYTYCNVDNGQVVAQKLTSNGALQWGSGVSLADSPGENSGPRIYQEGTGYIFLWEEEYEIANNDGARYFWQRLNADGTKNGTNLMLFDFAPAIGLQYYIDSLVPDGSGGFYVTIIGDDDLVAKLYLQRVLSNGTRAFGNSALGIEVDASIGKLVAQPGFSYVNYGAALQADGAGGVVVGWTDTRSSNDGLYAQRFNSSGTKLWTSTDVVVVPAFVQANFFEGMIKANQDGDFVFLINKVPSGSENHFYVQKISTAGVAQYGTSGVLASGRASYKDGEMVVSGSKVILVWRDYDPMNSQSRILAQSIFSSGVLPVKFKGFNAWYINGKTKVTWSTASEINNDYFEIQRSEDGISFGSIGVQKGADNSLEMREYDFTDFKAYAAGGYLYYRIKQVDKDGKFDFTEIKSVKVPTLSIAFKAYPNPVKSNLSIQLLDGKQANYSLSNVSGSTLKHGSFISSHEINMSELPNGIYILNVKTETDTFQEKVVKN